MTTNSQAMTITHTRFTPEGDANLDKLQAAMATSTQSATVTRAIHELLDIYKVRGIDFNGELIATGKRHNFELDTATLLLFDELRERMNCPGISLCIQQIVKELLFEYELNIARRW